MYFGKYSLLNDIKGWCSGSVVPRGCANKIRIWPLDGKSEKATEEDGRKSRIAYLLFNVGA